MLIFVIKFVCHITFQVEQLQTNTFNVKYNQKTFFVDLEKRTCTCRQFDLDEIPCSHAIVGIDKLYRNKYEYCSKWYDIMMYKNTYNGSLNPVGDKEDWNIPEDIKQEILLPRFTNLRWEKKEAAL